MGSKKRAHEIVQRGRESIAALLRECIKERGRIDVNNPWYAQAFGVAQGLHFAGLFERPASSESEFKKLVDEIEREEKKIRRLADQVAKSDEDSDDDSE